jgi:hypothetical protein
VAKKIKICTTMDTLHMRSQIPLFEELASSNDDAPFPVLMASQ